MHQVSGITQPAAHRQTVQAGFDRQSVLAPSVMETNDIFIMIDAARQMLGCPPGEFDQTIPFSTIPVIARHADDLHKITIRTGNTSSEYDFQNVDEHILKQNLLLFIYGYLEKQIKIYDEQVTSVSTLVPDSRDITKLMTFSNSVKDNKAHFGVYKFYRYPSYDTHTMLRGETDVENDMLLHNMIPHSASLKVFDLSAIPEIEADLEQLTESLRIQVGDGTADRVKQVVEAGCFFPRTMEYS